jgi:PEP-CTERM/exosortase A-associated glycosyltransferase
MKRRLLEVIAKEKPDVIHAHSPALNGMAAVLAGKAAGIPVVYEIRAFWEDAAVDHGTCREGDLRYRLTRALETYVIKRADAVTTICEGLRGDIVQRGISAAKITVIPNAVNIDQFGLISEKNAQLLAELGLTGKKVLGFLGSFYAYEGLDLLVAALPRLLAEDPDYRLLLVGGGPQEDALKAQIKALQLEHAVVMPGRVPHHQVNAYYSLVDLLVYPRKGMRLTELVTPLKPLEAMAQGKLVLASDVGGHLELITNNVTGWLFRKDDISDLCLQIRQIFANSALHSAIKTQGRNYVSQVRNWQQSVSYYQHVYPALVNS